MSILQAETLADAVAAFARVASLVQSGTRVDINTTSSRVQISITSIGTSTEDTSRHLLTGVQWLYGTVGLIGDQAPIEVRLGQAASGPTHNYEGFLGPNLAFGTGHYEIVLDRGLLELPLAENQRAEPQILDNGLSIDQMDDLHAVHAMVIHSLPRIRPTLGRVAAKFGVSSRTLQRRLQRWGLSFEEIVDEIRRSRAIAMIGEAQCPMIEVAWLLGYSDQAHFNRAFRRWTGMAPRAYQKHGIMGPTIRDLGSVSGSDD
jgi:AraC-like DNA-binding protein